MRKFKVSAAEAGQRADVFVAGQFPQFARSALTKLFDGQITVNGLPAKPGQKLKVGNKISVNTTLLNAKPSSIKLPIIYENEDVLVIDKPAGVLTHSTGGLSVEPSVASFIREYISDKNSKGDRAGIVHRLDRATSGVIICAKSSKSLAYLQKQFANRKTKKAYLAVVSGVPNPASGLIDVPLERNPKNPKTFMASASGKPAQTEYRVIKSFTKAGVTCSSVELKPLTGRTHQLRVHLAYIGHPVMGDSLYQRKGAVGRLMLHASGLELTLPSGERKKFESITPLEFTKL